MLDAPKIKAKACMLFPRTQYIQLQQEYFNVGLSFELFLRSFGELDVLHEDQVKDDRLSGYELLLLFDVELLPEAAAAHIAAFVQNGGTVIADCAPRLNADRKPMAVMEDLFGVKDAQGGRIRRAGHWVPYKNQAPIWANRPGGATDETDYATAALHGEALGTALDLTLVSPRPCTVTAGQALAMTDAGQPALVHRQVGAGQAFLLGFCLQDTYFKTWEDDNPAARAQLRALLRGMTQAAGIRPHVCSSNPDIEAAVRANEREGFLFVISHEAAAPAATVRLADLPFPVNSIVDLASGQPLTGTRETGGVLEIDVAVPMGEVRLYHLTQDKQAGSKPAENAATTRFSLWQLPNQTHTQMMSYVIRTSSGKVIVIDGGNAGDAPYLAEFLEGQGNTVEAWFISHAHSDHFDALREILKAPRALQIKEIYGSLPSQEWMDNVGSDGEKESLRRFNQALDDAGRTLTGLSLGQIIEIDGVRFEVLGVKNPEITQNPVNNSSFVLRVSDPNKSVLFPGDLGVEGGEKLLRGPMAGRIQADYVQMAHHGQNGVNEAFYQRVNPSYCLWPTPKWLWDNDNGGGKDSGPWRTLEVRAWMDKLPIKAHYPMFEGLCKIE